MADVTGPRALLDGARRHKVLTAVGAAVALSLVVGVVGLFSGADAAAVAAVVEQADETSAKIDTAQGALSDTIGEALLLAAQVRSELTDPADEAELQEAIAAAQALMVDSAVTATKEMSLAEANEAHAGAVAYLDDLETAQQNLRTAMDAASASHEAFLASAFKEARSAFDDARTDLRDTLTAADQVLTDSAGRVTDESVRDELRTAIGAARTASAAEPEPNHKAYYAATEEVQAAGRRVDAAREAVTAAVAAKAEADRIAAEQAAAEQAAADEAAANEAAANQAAEDTTAGGPEGTQPTPNPGGYYVFYSSCRAAWDAGAGPLYVGDPGYGRHLDRDGDGVACENRSSP